MGREPAIGSQIDHHLAQIVAHRRAELDEGQPGFAQVHKVTNTDLEVIRELLFSEPRTDWGGCFVVHPQRGMSTCGGSQRPVARPVATLMRNKLAFTAHLFLQVIALEILAGNDAEANSSKSS